jgi:hypothetical protein
MRSPYRNWAGSSEDTPTGHSPGPATFAALLLLLAGFVALFRSPTFGHEALDFAAIVGLMLAIAWLSSAGEHGSHS